MSGSAQGAKKKNVQSQQNIKVAVRVRPLNDQEKAGNVKSIVKCLTPKSIQFKDKKYNFDKVFKPDSTQVDVYMHVVAPMISDVLSGYNCTVFAYGQTGSGKTFTMIGENATSTKNWKDDSSTGCIPRAAANIFEEIDCKGSTIIATVRVSFLEIYNEEMYDLLSDLDKPPSLGVFSDGKGQITIQGLKEIPVKNLKDLYKLLDIGTSKRQTACTLMNEQSSRSHTVFTIIVNMRESSETGEDILRVGKINLVDLAGSENIGKSGVKDMRAVELANINKSLLTLGRVIHSLAENKNTKSYVPYRDSKLTRLLQDSLGGNTETYIIATVSPVHTSHEETASTLEYSSKARDIKNTPMKNEKITKEEMLKDMMKEIEHCKKDLEAARGSEGFFLAKSNWDELNQKVMSVTASLLERDKIIQEKHKKLIEAEARMEEKLKDFEEIMKACKFKEESLNKVEEIFQERQIALKQEKTISYAFEDIVNQADINSRESFKLNQQLTKMNAVLKDKIEQHYSSQTKNEKLIKNTLPMISKNMAEVIENEEDHKNKQFRNVSKLEEAHKTIKNNVEDSIENIKTSLQDNKDNHIVEGIKNNLIEPCTKLKKSIIDTRDQFRIDEEKRMQEITEKLSLIQESKKTLCEVLDKNKKDDTKILKFLTDFNESLVAEKQKDDMYVNKYKHFFNDRQRRRDRLLTATTHLAHHFNTSLNNLAERADAVAADIKNKVEVYEESVLNSTSNIKEDYLQTADICQNFVEKIEKKSINALELHTGCSEKLNNIHKTLDKGFDNLTNCNVSRQLNINNHHSTVSILLEASKRSLENDILEKVQSVKHTGDTPQAQRFSLGPRKLEAVPSRESVIRKFWESRERLEISNSNDSEDEEQYLSKE